MQSEFYPPEQMTNNDRMKRLYDTLLQMGLIVFPICNKENPEIIDHLNVSVTLPFHRLTDTGETTTQTSVTEKMKRTKIANVVRTAQNLGSNVINMPTIP